MTAASTTARINGNKSFSREQLKAEEADDVMTEKTSCGTVRRLWAECYDSEMGRFLLAPIEELSCNSCPIGKAAKKPVRLSIILKKLRDLKNEIRRRVWLPRFGQSKRGISAPILQARQKSLITSLSFGTPCNKLRLIGRQWKEAS